MKIAYRMMLYLLGGGVLLALARPAPGLMESAACVGLILVTALVDARLAGHPQRGKTAAGAVSMASYRNRKAKSNGSGALLRERRALQTVYRGHLRREAENLMTLLREGGMNPIMVSSTAAGQRNEAMFEVRLPSAEVPQARTLVEQFLAQLTPVKS